MKKILCSAKVLHTSCLFYVTYFSKIRQIIDTFGSHLHIELQQRGVEFSQLFRKYEHMRPALLERMPPMETARPNAVNNPAAMTNGETSEDLDSTGDEGNLHVDGRKGFGESEIQDSVSICIGGGVLDHNYHS
jgi:hypothetical protein